MEVNILIGIYNIANAHNTSVRDFSPIYRTRINSVGEQLEVFVKDAIAGTIGKDESEAKIMHSEVYSWLGRQNNPPDLIIRNGDAFEVKKIEGTGRGNLALNSSHPKNKLYSDDPKITKDCKNCESQPWDTKDIYYVIGRVPQKEIKSLIFTHGLCFVAEREIYDGVTNKIKDKTDENIEDSGFTSNDTKELGRINKVDPLGITNLRIRGMWEIKSPYFIFNEYIQKLEGPNFSLFAIMTSEKYNSYSSSSRRNVENHPDIKIQDIDVLNPNNPAKTIPSKLISCSW